MLKAIDHVVLTVRDMQATLKFYEEALSMPVIRFGGDRYALQIGTQKLNLHEAGKEIEPKAMAPTSGCIDICFLTDTPICEVAERLDQFGIEIEMGPCARTGATGPLKSIYIRDPDGNLVELANSM